MITLYGIANCDTVRKARRWLKEKEIAYQFHDVRKDGLEAEHLASWVDALGWEALLNRKGTTFRKLPDDKKQALDSSSAQMLMLEQPAMIKRPVVENAQGVSLEFSVGFDTKDWQQRFG